MGRPRKYATDADRQSAYRDRTRAVPISDAQIETIDRMAAAMDCSRAELVRSMIHFAMMTRQWVRLGLVPVHGPRARPPAGEAEASPPDVSPDTPDDRQ